MTWLYLVLIANLLNAFVVLFDKYLVGPRAVGHSEVYAFYIGTLSATVLVMAPFGFVGWPTSTVLLLALIVGFAYMGSIIYLYKSLRNSAASDVAPVVGSVAALATFFFSWLFLKQIPSSHFLLAFVLLVIGTTLMSYFRFNRKAVFYLVVAGALFGYSSVFLKILFEVASFADGFFWSRLANAFAALLLLAVPLNRRIIMARTRAVSAHTKQLVFGNKILAGLAALLLFIAIKVSSVSVVNALGGLQFVFLLGFAYVFPHTFPHYFEPMQEVHDYETMKSEPRGPVALKLVATAFIIGGFGLLFL